MRLNFALLSLLLGASATFGKELRGVEKPSRELQTLTCTDRGLDTLLNDNLMAVLSTIAHSDAVMEGLEQFATQGVTIGSTTALIPEANDANVTGATIADGQSGDTNFPHGNLKPLATSGERSVCPESYGNKLTGTPDGLGAYLPSDDVLRIVVQSEGYGPLRIESWKFPVNDGAATFGGSHIQYVDYDREMFATFMNNDDPASSMVVGMGEMIEKVVNLKGETVGPRNGESETKVGAHYTNTDANGTYSMLKIPAESDWFLQSLCSAHMEQKYQWGDGIGVADDMFVTNEEWAHYQFDKEFVGLSAHALDVQTKTLYAIGAFTNGGFEKIVEINPQSPDYVMFAVSGYNGAYDNSDYLPDETLIPQNVLDLRNAEFGPRPDGKNYSWPQNIVPFRIYVGVKGKLEDGTDAPEDDFMARNGLKYGQLYGFAIDMRNTTEVVGPTAGVFRDEWHKTASNGDMVPGKWVAQPWRWDGVGKPYVFLASSFVSML